MRCLWTVGVDKHMIDGYYSIIDLFFTVFYESIMHFSFDGKCKNLFMACNPDRGIFSSFSRLNSYILSTKGAQKANRVNCQRPFSAMKLAVCRRFFNCIHSCNHGQLFNLMSLFNWVAVVWPVLSSAFIFTVAQNKPCLTTAHSAKPIMRLKRISRYAPNTSSLDGHKLRITWRNECFKTIDIFVAPSRIRPLFLPIIFTDRRVCIINFIALNYNVHTEMCTSFYCFASGSKWALHTQ